MEHIKKNQDNLNPWVSWPGWFNMDGYELMPDCRQIAFYEWFARF